MSIVATAVAAIGQAVSDTPGASSVALGSYTNEIGDTEDHSGLTNAFFKGSRGSAACATSRWTYV